MGTRDYALKICGFIDPEKRFFGSRIVTRSENFQELTKCISRITCISKNVIMVDDRIDVWAFSRNLLPIKPYWYHDKIDINDPKLIESKNNIADSEIKQKKSQSSKEDIIIANLNCNVENIEVLEGNPVDSYRIEQSECYDKNILQLTKCMNKKRGNNDLPNPKRFKRTESICPEDNELIRILKILKKVHHSYFKHKKSVGKILRIKNFKNVKIAADIQFLPYLIFIRANIDIVNPTYVIENENMAKKCHAINIEFRWINDCIYEWKFLNIDDYIISDHRIISQYQQELENEFFNNL